MRVSALLISIVFIAVTGFTPNDKEETKVLISTSYGDIKIKLYNETPKHRDNFIKLAKEGFYKGTLFHRVIRDFMIQGGDPDSRGAGPKKKLGDGGPGYTIPAEFHDSLFHKKGALAAARLGDNINPEKASSGSQFYIVQGRKFREEDLEALEQSRGIEFTGKQKKVYNEVGGTPHLDGSYTVFGEVIQGMDVVGKIAETETGRGDRPVEDVVIEGVEVIEE